MVHARGTTHRKAVAQMRLLNAIEHDPDFKPRRKARARRRSSSGYLGPPEKL